jgi:hypothetical protein
MYRALAKRLTEKAAIGIIADFFAATKGAYFLDSYKALVMYRLAADPPDESFHVFASPPPLGYPRDWPTGFPRRLAVSTKLRLFHRARDASVHIALLQAIERAAGAKVAGDAAAESAQLSRAADLASMLVKRLTSERLWLLASSRALKRSGIHFRIPTAVLRKAKRVPFAGTEGRIFRKSLLRDRFSPFFEEDLDAATKASRSMAISGLTHFPAAFGLAERARLVGREVEELRAFADKYPH